MTVVHEEHKDIFFHGQPFRFPSPLWRGEVRIAGLRKNISLCSCAFMVLLLLQTLACAETIHYAIIQTGLKVGDATLRDVGPAVYRGKHTFLIVFKAQAINFLDEERIYTDPLGFYPLFVQRDLNIFGQKEKILEVYDRAKSEVVVTKTVGHKRTEQVLKRTGAIDNIYGFILRYRRSGSFKIGDVLDVFLATTDLKIELVKRLTFQMQGKQYDSYFMQSKPAKYKIWFDSSAQKWPLRISGAIGIANTVMEMTGHEE